MKKQSFVPSAQATTYQQVQHEAAAFYRATTSHSDGMISRLAAQAAKRWERNQERAANVEQRFPLPSAKV